MPVSKIHLMLGQSVIDAPTSIAYITENEDPQETWYASTLNAVVWDGELDQLGTGFPNILYTPLLSCTWSNGGASGFKGTRCGPDVSFIREVSQAETSDVHCLVKLRGDGALRAGTSASNRWDKAGADLYPLIAAEITACRAALVAALPANPVEIGSVTICLGYFALANATISAALRDDLEQLIADLRSDLAAITGQTGSQIPVLLWRIPNWSRLSEGGPYADANLSLQRNACHGIAYDDPYVAVIDVDRIPFKTDRIAPSSDGGLEAGEAMARAYFQIVDPTIPASTDGGLPVVVYVGQSNVAGSTPVVMLSSGINADPQLIQDYTDKVWIYDWIAQDVVTYVPTSNGNSGPDALWNDSSLFGPDVGATPELLEVHAATGFCWFKLGVNAASLGVNTVGAPIWLKRYSSLADCVWPTFEDGWDRFKAACVAATGRVPDVRLIVVHQGESDTEAALAPYYADNLRTWIADLRAMLNTNTRSEDQVPVGIVKLQDIPTSSWPDDGVAAVRAAQVAVAADDGNFLVDIDDAPYRSDNIHLSGEGSLRAGRRVRESLPAWYSSGQPSGG